MAVIDVTERSIVFLGAITFRTVSASGVAGSGGVGAPSITITVTATSASSAGEVGSPSITLVGGPVGIASGEALGEPRASFVSYPSGFSTTGDVGTAKTNLTYNPIQIYPSSAVGLPTGGVSVLADGFASVGDVGSPRLNKVMNPAGISSGGAFGTVKSLATALIVPGPIDPSNDFGDPLVTKRGWIFRGPTIQLGWRFQKRYEGVSLLKESGSWVEVSHPDLERTRAAEKYLPGGHDHVVSDSLKAELVSAGYTVTSEVVTTEEYKS